MAGLDLSTANARLEAWLAADEALTTRGAKSYRISAGGTERELTSFDLPEIRKSIDYWHNWTKRLSRTGGLRVSEVIPK